MWVVENQGFGPALDVRYTCCDGNQKRVERFIPSLAKGAEYPAQNDVSATFEKRHDFEIRYRSLSGQPYITIVRKTDDGTQTEFRKS